LNVDFPRFEIGAASQSLFRNRASQANVDFLLRALPPRSIGEHGSCGRRQFRAICETETVAVYSDSSEFSPAKVCYDAVRRFVMCGQFSLCESSNHKLGKKWVSGK
jgi:hypothetical protein